MLVYGLNNETCSSFYFFKNLEIKKEINKLDILSFEIPKDYRNIFETECKTDENKQSYTIKNIEPFYDGYKIECKQNIDEWLSFFHKSLNFPYKDIETMIKGIIPFGWSYKINGEIKKYRTITADHKSSWEVLKEIVKKFNVEFRLDNNEKILFISEKIGEDKGVFFSDNFNVVDKDISVESFEFATRIIPEGMNGLKINQINDGKDYLENKSYSGKTINYYWKDERYTNIQNLKNDAAKKLEILSRPRITIKLKVKDLSKAIGVYEQEYNVGDYVYLIDKDRKTKERFRVLAGTFFPNKPFDNEIYLANKPLDLLDEVDENIELTKEMWEETRGRFEATDEAIKGSVATAKRYTDDSFKTYKTEREQTDSRIYESITESTTYVDPKTGQTKPIIDKQLEIDKTIDSIDVSLKDQLTANKDFADRLEGIKENISENNISINDKIDKDLAKVKKELGDSIDYTKVDFAERHDLLALELESASKIISEANAELGELSNKFDDFNTTAENKYQIIDKEILGIKSNFKVARDEITAEIISASKSQEQAINQVGKDTEASIKTYLNANYSTSTQTDEKISQEVGSLKTLVNADIGDLSKEISQAKSMIEQTDNRITSSVETITKGIDARIGASIEHTNNEVSSLRDYVSKNYSTISQTDSKIASEVSSVRSSFNSSISSLSSRISQTANEISTKVSKNGIISAINQSAERIKINASRIDLEGDVSVKGEFTTLNDSNDVGIDIRYNSITFQDNRWNGKKFGQVNVTENRNNPGAYALNMGHYPTGTSIISYYENAASVWRPYVRFDRWNYTGDGGASQPICFYEGVRFKEDIVTHGIIHFKNGSSSSNFMRIIVYSNGIGIENYSKEGLFVNTDGRVGIKNSSNSVRYFDRSKI